MSNTINTRGSFFPGKTDVKETGTPRTRSGSIQRNDFEKQKIITERTKDDAKVDIPDAVKDFAQIKKIADATPSVDNSAKIADLKKRINNGTYQIDYDALAEKMLVSEF